MKKCEEFAPLLSAFVDGELTEEERAEVLAHVSGSKRRCTCRACRTGGSGDVFDGGAVQRSAARYGRRGGISRAAL